MNKALQIFLITVFLGFFFTGCKDRSTDSYWVVSQYLAALEQGNLQKAYQFVTERPLLVMTSTGEEVLFRGRPDLEVYQNSFGGLAGMKVLEITYQAERSIPEQFVVYRIAVTGIGQTDVEKKVLLEMYLAADSTGAWEVLLPPPPPAEPVISDSLEISVPRGLTRRSKEVC